MLSSFVVRAVASLVVTMLVFAGLLFVPAGTFGWPRAWWFLAVFAITTAVSALYLWRINPEIFAARRRIGAGTKWWDRFLLPFILMSFLGVPLVAGIDRRFHSPPLRSWLVVVGYVIFLGSFALETWAQAVNRHFEPSVRIQTDRDHRVVTTGPYAIVRHPGYIGGIVFAAGMALALGSRHALIATLALAVVLVVRTVKEDATLGAELAGYRDYQRRVRYRWIPKVW